MRNSFSSVLFITIFFNLLNMLLVHFLGILMVHHFYRGAHQLSSRLNNQLKFDEGVVFDNSRFFEFDIFKNVEEKGVYIFHQHVMLLNLIFFYCYAKFKGYENIRIIFDAHDLNEIKVKNRFVSYIYYAIFVILESAVFKLDIKYMTVSKGLSRVLFLKYGKKVHFVPNVEKFNPLSIKARSSEIKAIYFGQINEERFPISLMSTLIKAGILIDVYGYLSGETSCYRDYFYEQSRQGVIHFKGKYSPDNINIILKDYDLSLLYFPSNRLNLRYCLPNKLLQSISSGVPCLISDNLVEAKFAFGKSKMVINFNEIADFRYINFNLKIAQTVLERMREMFIENYSECLYQ